MIHESVKAVCEKYMRGKGDRFVPARLQAALALLERLRDHSSLQLEDHRAAPGSSGLASHETYGDTVHERLGLVPLNKNHGRRSSNLQEWGASLLGCLANAGFQDMSQVDQARLLDAAQDAIAGLLREIVEQEPIVVFCRGRTVDMVITDVLDQAAEKNRLGDVAQYLVGAKLMLRFSDLTDRILVVPANKGDRKHFSDTSARLGDFEINDVVIEVAAGPPDDKHLDQIATVLDDPTAEVLLLTRFRHTAFWYSRVQEVADQDARRVSVRSIETFVGQNIAELGSFSIAGKKERLVALADIYNRTWIAQFGSPGIQLEIR